MKTSFWLIKTIFSSKGGHFGYLKQKKWWNLTISHDFLADSCVKSINNYYLQVQNVNLIIFGVTGTQNGPLLPKKLFSWAKNCSWVIFWGFFSQNLVLASETNLSTLIDDKLWPKYGKKIPKNVEITKKQLFLNF